MLKRATLALAASVTALTAAPAVFAADLPLPPIVEPEPLPPAAPSFSGWYLRGDIGITNQRLDKITSSLIDQAIANGDTVSFVNDPEFDSGGFAGVGIGYQINPWARVDLTGEYRGKTSFSAFDTYVGADPAFVGSNEYEAMKSEWLFLANAYVDLGSWHGFSPYVGAGIGASRNTISGMRDINTPNGYTSYGGDHSEWNLAWALHAGLAYQVTPNLALDLGYRYVNLGDAESADMVGYDGNNDSVNPIKFKDIDSHDVKLGVRYTFGGPAAEPDPMYYGEPAVVKY
ncbi:outer membrane protein [Afifella marina]|uniref:Opacity protein n=1 Tax=Afifella marina DSM 2698 TaxID=1120955 RepID=A0A1G5P678_AFIMA|nr:Opacity protein [Afifella marina DSM 2698]